MAGFGGGDGNEGGAGEGEGVLGFWMKVSSSQIVEGLESI